MPDGTVQIYGLHPAETALANARRTFKAVYLTRNASNRLSLPDGCPAPEMVERKALDRMIADDAVHQGILLVAATLAQPSLQDFLENLTAESVVVVLDQVTDPHNVGAIFRSAAAFGAAAIITTLRNAPPETGVLLKSASGAFDLLPYIQVRNLAEAMDSLKLAGVTLIGLDSNTGQTLASYDRPGGPLAIVLGAEGKGLRQKTAEMCDVLLRLPINPAVGSLNVSNAAAVALYALSKPVFGD